MNSLEIIPLKAQYQVTYRILDQLNIIVKGTKTGKVEFRLWKNQNEGIRTLKTFSTSPQSEFYKTVERNLVPSNGFDLKACLADLSDSLNKYKTEGFFQVPKREEPEEKQPDFKDYLLEELKNDKEILSGSVQFSERRGLFFIVPPLSLQKQYEVPVFGEFNENCITLESKQSNVSLATTQRNDTYLAMPDCTLKSMPIILDKSFHLQLMRLIVSKGGSQGCLDSVDPLILRELVDKVGWYMFFENHLVYTVIACYILGTYCYQVFARYPFLIFRGEKDAGKGTILRIFSMVAWNATDKILNPSESSIFRLIEGAGPTMVIDEYHRLIKNPVYGKIYESLFEAGTEKNCKVPRVDENNLDRINFFNVYCPKVIGSREITEQENKGITLIMDRTLEQKYAKRYNELQFDPFFKETRIKLLQLVFERQKAIYEAYKAMNPSNKLTGRPFTLWSPILSICKVFFPDEYNDMWTLAECLTESDKSLKKLESENIVLQALAENWEQDLLDETNPTLKVSLADLKIHSEIQDGRTLYSALSNLKVIKTEAKQIYYLHKAKLLKLMKDRRISLETEETQDNSGPGDQQTLDRNSRNSPEALKPQEPLMPTREVIKTQDSYKETSEEDPIRREQRLSLLSHIRHDCATLGVAREELSGFQNIPEGRIDEILIELASYPDRRIYQDVRGRYHSL